MRYLMQEFFLLDVQYRFQVLILFCLLVFLIITVIALTIVKKAKDKK